jgi:hypothetical protein
MRAFDAATALGDHRFACYIVLFISGLLDENDSILPKFDDSKPVVENDDFWRDAVETAVPADDVESLVRAFEFVDPSTESLRAATVSACGCGHLEVAKYLIGKLQGRGEEVSYASLLTEALSYYLSPWVRDTAEYLFSMNNNKPSLRNPAKELRGAVVCGSEVIVREMLKCDEVDVNAAVQVYNGAAHSALSGASEPHIIKILLDAKAEVNPTGCETVLRSACADLRVDAVQMLLEAKADVNWPPIGQSAAYYALGGRSADGQIDVINLLHAAGLKACSMHDVLREQRTFSNARAYAVLLAHYPELLEVRGRDRLTPLLRVAEFCWRNVDMIETLVSAGADVLATDGQNQTVLFHMLRLDTIGRREMFDDEHIDTTRSLLQFLLRAGADPTQGRDYHGHTLLMELTKTSAYSDDKDKICSLYITDLLDGIKYRAPATYTGTGTGTGTGARAAGGAPDTTGAEQDKKRRRL